MIKARINKQVAAVGIFTVVLMVMWFVFFIGLCSSLGYLGFSTSHFQVMSDFNFATKTGPMILFILICIFVLFALVKSIKATKRHKNTVMVRVSFGIMLIGAVGNLFRKGKQTCAPLMISELTFIGYFLFLMVWEANNRQLYNMLPIMLIGYVIMLKSMLRKDR